MTGISIAVELRDTEAQDRLRALMARMDNRKTFFERIGDKMLLSTSNNFRNQTDPDGGAWKPLRPATIRARTRKKQLPLTILRSNTKGKSGSSLAGSINRQVSEDELRIGSPLVQAAIHQLGGTIQKPAGTRWMAGRRFARRADAPDGREVAIKAHSITIPARPFLGLSRADEAMVLEEAEDWLSL